MGRGGILQVEIDAAAGDADEDEHQLIPPGQLHGFGAQSPQGQIGQAHAQGNDLDGGKGLKHHLGQHEAAAPHQGREQGKQVPCELLLMRKSDFRHCFSLSVLQEHRPPEGDAPCLFIPSAPRE